MITGVNHAQINVPTAALEQAREFYVGFLGMKQKFRPPVFNSDGVWMDAGSFELHIGLEDGIDRKTRAHIAFEVDDLAALRKRVEARGYKIVEQPKIPGWERFHFRDPFGNNLEVMQRE